MRIFLSHASEQAQIAEHVAVALRNAGHSVFLDKDSLPAAESYDDRIRAAIGRSDLFLFLVSPESVSTGRYALTELKFARERWPRPGNKVLPVMAAPTPIADVPPYLSALNILKPEGNLVAEVAALVEKRGSSGPMLRIAGIVAAVVIVLGGLGAGAWWITHNSSTVAKKVALEAQVDNCAVINELLQVKSPDQLSQAAIRQSEMCRELSALQGGDPRERKVADLMAQGEVDQALGLLEEMAKAPPESVDRWERLATLAALRDPDQAARAREAIERLAPADAANRLQLAQLYAANRPQDWLRINQDVFATATDPMAKALANWALCGANPQLVAANPGWRCEALNARDLISAFNGTQLDKSAACSSALAALFQRVAMLSLTAGASTDTETHIAALADAAEGMKFFAQEQLKSVTNQNMSELLRIQVDDTTIASDMFAQLMPPMRAGDIEGARKVFAAISARYDALSVRAQALAASFDSPLVAAEQGSIAHSQGLLQLQGAALAGGPIDAARQAAVLQKLREETGFFKSVHQRSPKIGVPMIALFMLNQWLQSAGQAQADWLGPQIAGDQLMWVDIVAAQKPAEPSTRLMLLQAHWLAWKFAEPAARDGELQQVKQLLAEVSARTDMAGAEQIIGAIGQDVAAAETLAAEPEPEPEPSPTTLSTP